MAIVNKMVSMMEGVIQVSNTTFPITVTRVVQNVVNSPFPCFLLLFSWITITLLHLDGPIYCINVLFPFFWALAKILCSDLCHVSQ